MRANLEAEFETLPLRVKIGGAFAVAALALLGLDTGLNASRPAPAAPPPAAAPAPAGLRNLAYYPEQLAVLASLSEFTPEAESGVAAPSPAAVKPAPRAPPPKALRRVEATTALRRPEATTAAAVVPPPGPAAASAIGSMKFLGLALPGSAAIGAQAASLRDGAAHLSEAALNLGSRLVFWR
ncbi:hypothetical protein K9U33_18095 [Rhodoblastus acidophilus]|uniref:Uncharacterized protein n=1 Tax=Candidatus Rhodoblastus alkanivorans TaxID=2954117 RepID=A0ABS9Z5D7_9HYPH|nr:hypothetical protein [Candidatus Rhodoblastus alkanivorans]MCI4680537.1 hypothetical protein [Candidatus Rhodoblastus alkanivorans]MCI4682812.1 hypothetical protein [Candidatus Rhodoblastus alkanivorans]